MKRIGSLIIAFAASLLLPLNAAAQGLRVEAPTVVSLDEAFNVQYIASGKVKEFFKPEFEDFHVLAGPTSSTMNSIQFVNGKRSQTYEVTYTYVLQAKSTGKFTIPSASADVAGKVQSSGTRSIEVVASGQQPQSSPSQESSSGGSSYASAGELMLKLQLSKTSVVKGEPIIATLKLYARNAAISGFEDVTFPTFEGFWSQEIEAPQNINFERENVGGQIYDAALLRRYMLLPQQSGQISIDPAEIICLLQVRAQNSQRGRSIFDDFFDSGYQTVRRRVATDKINVNVRALPDGAPADFTGGVGDLNMTVRLSKDSLKAHEAGSLIVTISGTGNLSMVDAPKINFPPDFEVYDIKKTDNVKAGRSGLSGTRTFEYPFIPRSAGDFTMEPVTLSYYNIKGGRYLKLSSDPIPVKVARSEGTDASVFKEGGINKQSVRSLGEDIRYISTSAGRLRRSGDSFVSSPWMWITAMLIVAAYVAVRLIVGKVETRRADVAGGRRRKALKVAKARLKKANSYLAQGLGTAFIEELHKALIGYVADKLTIAPADLDRDTIREKLLERGSSQEAIEGLFALLDECEYARYAPPGTHEALDSKYQTALKVIADLED
ncbi:MAG: protein BatD [Bacteroidales bacterium]|nr:protein BatD [Bacteroidales bacterium]